MQVRTVKRKDILAQRSSRSKYSKVYEYLDKLVDDGDAVQVVYDVKKELNSIRNLVYNYNAKNGTKVKSFSNSEEKTIYFYKGSIQ
jgi:hypothetical protein